VLGAILTAMATPFDASGAVDREASAALMHHLVAHGSDGLVLSGTTGESATLTDEEKIELFRWGVEEFGGRAGIVAGTGSNDTAHSVELTREAKALGVDAVLVVTPYYNNPPRAGIVAHFAAVAEVGVPVIVYNIPSRTGINMPPDLLAELAGIPNVMGLKQASPELSEAEEVRDRAPDLRLWAGNDDMLLPVLRMGGVGVISVASHLAGERMRAVVDAVARGDDAEADRLDRDLRDLYAGLFVTTSPILLKAALAMGGLIPSDRLRLPLVPATPVQRDILRTVLEAQGLLARAGTR
jgi:4-hydroxy-tetrahydrodipicolinate synthase